MAGIERLTIVYVHSDGRAFQETITSTRASAKAAARAEVMRQRDQMGVKTIAVVIGEEVKHAELQQWLALTDADLEARERSELARLLAKYPDAVGV